MVKRTNHNEAWRKRCHRISQVLKGSWRNFSEKVRPYLAMKYWPIYLIAFALGFYLWGPGHGIRKIQAWSFPGVARKTDQKSIGNLQQELNRLKRELAQEKGKSSTVVFDPTSFSRPALGEVIQGYDWVYSEKSWRFHPGVDIITSGNPNVLAAAAGMVTKVQKTANGDMTVTLDHGSGWTSYYAGLSGIQVSEGQRITKGVILGASGNLNCLPGESGRIGFHFAIYRDQQPLDPRNIIKGLVKI
ncbi:MAG TPA: M23 family metallopeptidase [Bacillota bacterium]